MLKEVLCLQPFNAVEAQVDLLLETPQQRVQRDARLVDVLRGLRQRLRRERVGYQDEIGPTAEQLVFSVLKAGQASFEEDAEVLPHYARVGTVTHSFQQRLVEGVGQQGYGLLRW